MTRHGLTNPGPRTLLTVLMLAALVLTGCTGPWDAGSDTADPGDPGAPDDAAVGQVDWQPCPELPEEVLAGLGVPGGMADQVTREAEYHCGDVSVPQDWDAPDSSGTYDIALVRVRHAEQTDRIGSLLVNPGGPGSSGVDSAVQLSLQPLVGGLPDRVLTRFDLVGFDPRGVARSAPVDCFSDAQRDAHFGSDPYPTSTQEFDEAVTRIRDRAEACTDAHGEALDTFSTRQAAHDLDALREAVGDEKLTYLGYSYGSQLGAVYAHLYPEDIRAMVLDGAVDPTRGAVAATEQQIQGFEESLDDFAAWCDEQADECELAPDARTVVRDAITDAEDDPVTSADGREVTGGWVLYAVVATLYSRDAWPQLATALTQLDSGDPAGVLALADSYASRDEDGSYSNMFDASTVVNCADGQPDVTEQEVRRLQEEWRQEYPVFGPPLVLSLLSCADWPTEPDPAPTGQAEGAPEILVVGTRGDPATPYESTQELADHLGVGVVLTWEGQGHTAYPKTTCISEAVDAYLIDRTVPDDGTTCPA